MRGYLLVHCFFNKKVPILRLRNDKVEMRMNGSLVLYWFL